MAHGDSGTTETPSEGSTMTSLSSESFEASDADSFRSSSKSVSSALRIVFVVRLRPLGRDSVVTDCAISIISTARITSFKGEISGFSLSGQGPSGSLSEDQIRAYELGRVPQSLQSLTITHSVRRCGLEPSGHSGSNVAAFVAVGF